MFKHIYKCIIAGIISILPIAGTILTIGYLETTISGSGISKLPFYFPGLGLLLSGILIYLLGLFATTIFGRWIWNRIDILVYKLPAVGKLYGSLKQILGYGEGDEAVFQEVVMVKSSFEKGEEIGLITNRFKDTSGIDKLVVFIPATPNPTSGKMIILSPESVKPTAITVHDALKSIVTIGKTNLHPVS